MNQVVYNARRRQRGFAGSIKIRGLGDDEDFNPYAPAEWGSGYSDYWDQAAGIYWDEYGNQWDVGGSGVFDYSSDPNAGYYDAQGNFISTATGYALDPGGPVNLAALQDEFNFWNSLTGNNAPVTLPAITYNAGYILSVPSTTLASDPNAPAVLRSASTWDKIKSALAKVAKNVSMSAGAGSGAAAGSRPQSVQANAQGQCPNGYAKNAAGQCVLVSAKPADGDFLSNPLYLLLGAIGLILLVKR